MNQLMFVLANALLIIVFVAFCLLAFLAILMAVRGDFVSKKVLFLDDNPERQKSMMDYLRQDKATTAEEAIILLQNSMDKGQFYDVVFLDHDLGGKEMVDSYGDEETGFTVVTWIIEKRPYIPLIVVHSLNQRGASLMIAMLEANGYKTLRCDYLTLSRHPEIIKNHEPYMSEHDKLRRDKALKADWTDREELLDAVRGLQSTDDPSLVPLHDFLLNKLNTMESDNGSS